MTFFIATGVYVCDILTNFLYLSCRMKSMSLDMYHCWVTCPAVSLKRGTKRASTMAEEVHLFNIQSNME